MHEGTETQPAHFDLTNARIAYRWASSRELQRAAMIYRLMSWRWATRWGSKILAWSVQHGLPGISLVRGSLFRQFFAGETLSECQQLGDKLAPFGVGAVFNYAVEGAGDEASFYASYQEILATIPIAALHKPGFAVFKMSALCSPELLTKLSAQRSLTRQEEHALSLLRTRIDHLAHECSHHEISLLIDAEESWGQAAIDTLSLELAAKYNAQRAVVYLTLQMYRHDRLAYLQQLSQESREKGYFLGIKLVRGAYLELENLRASTQGLPSPLYQSKGETDQAYNQAITFSVEQDGQIALFLGTHNLASSQLLAELLSRQQDKSRIPAAFAQLLGMCDFLSFNLAKYGFRSYKYIPYGPIRQAIPYLLRRAEENTALESQVPFELQLLKQELKQRKEKSS